MLESLINPKAAERRPSKMFFIGFLYAVVSVAIVDLVFLRDSIMAKYASLLVITFTTMFSIPFMYFLIKLEEEKDMRIRKESKLLREHGKALAALLWLFLGYLVAFSLLFIVMPQHITAANFEAQIKQYCAINFPSHPEKCVAEYGIPANIIGRASGIRDFKEIITNNIFVMFFVLIFSLAFGAGAIFILAWNASVIAVAVATFVQKKLAYLHFGLFCYMLHGLPEIAAYFAVALAGGIVGIASIKHNIRETQFWNVMRDSISMTLLAFLVLVIAALIEITLTPAVCASG